MMVSDIAAGNGQASGHGEPPWMDFAHTGPGTLAGRFMRMFWHPIYRAQDLPSGRAVPIRIMSEDFTLYRGENSPPSQPFDKIRAGSSPSTTEGKPHLLAFRCAHRGTQLSVGWVEGDNLRCRYHGWAYDGSGQCTEQPGESPEACERIRIRSYPIRENLGFIFAYLGEGEAPPFPEFPEFSESGGLLDPQPPALSPCNYFQRIENGPDELHLFFAHRTGHTGSPYIGTEFPRLEVQETDYGFIQLGHRPTGVRTYNYITPNLGYLANHPRYPEEMGQRRRLIWRVPVDDTSYWSFATLLINVKGEAKERYRERMLTELAEARADNDKMAILRPILAGQMRVEDIQRSSATADMENSTNLEDDVVQVGQGVIADRSQDHLARQDVAIVLLRQIWARELRALAEGRPMKPWRIGALPAVSGGVRAGQ